MDIVTWRDHEVELLSGVKVTAEIRPLTTDEIIIVQPYMSDDKTDADGKLKQDEAYKGQKNMGMPLSQAVRNIKGITMDSKEVTPLMLSSEACFLELAWKFVFALVKISSVTEEEEKNSEGQSQELSSEDVPLIQ